MGKLEEINGQSPNSQMLSLASVLCYVVVWRLWEKLLNGQGCILVLAA